MSYRSQVIQDAPTFFHIMNAPIANGAIPDLSGNGRTAQYGGSVSTSANVPGVQKGPSLFLTRSSVARVARSALSLGITNDLTIEAVFRMTTAASNGLFIFGDTSANAVVRLSVSASNTITFAAHGVALLYASALSLATFYHVVGTYDSVSRMQRIYLNGVEVAVVERASPLTPQVSSVPGVIGGSYPVATGSILNAGEFFSISGYNYALSAGRVKSHYAALRSKYDIYTVSGVRPSKVRVAA